MKNFEIVEEVIRYKRASYQLWKKNGTSSAFQWLASVSQFGPLSGIGRCKENLSPLSSYLDFCGCWCFWLDCSILILILIWPMIITRFMSWILPLFTVLEIAKNFNVLHTFLKNAGGSLVGFSPKFGIFQICPKILDHLFQSVFFAQFITFY